MVHQSLKEGRLEREKVTLVNTPTAVQVHSWCSSYSEITPAPAAASYFAYLELLEV